MNVISYVKKIRIVIGIPLEKIFVFYTVHASPLIPSSTTLQPSMQHVRKVLKNYKIENYSPYTIFAI